MTGEGLPLPCPFGQEDKTMRSKETIEALQDKIAELESRIRKLEETNAGVILEAEPAGTLPKAKQTGRRSAKKQ